MENQPERSISNKYGWEEEGLTWQLQGCRRREKTEKYCKGHGVLWPTGWGTQREGWLTQLSGMDREGDAEEGEPGRWRGPWDGCCAVCWLCHQLPQTRGPRQQWPCHGFPRPEGRAGPSWVLGSPGGKHLTRRKRALSSFVDGLEVPGKPGEARGSQAGRRAASTSLRRSGALEAVLYVHRDDAGTFPTGPSLAAQCEPSTCQSLRNRDKLWILYRVLNSSPISGSVWSPPASSRSRAALSIPKPALPTVSVLAGGAQVGHSVPSRGPAQTCPHFLPPTVPLLPPFCHELFLAPPQTPSKRQPHLSNSLLIPTCLCQRSHLPAV